MNLAFRYLEQKGLTPRHNSKSINWNNLISMQYNTEIDNMLCFDAEYRMYRSGAHRILLTLEFDISFMDPLKEMEDILAPRHDQLEFTFKNNRITIIDAYLKDYSIDNQFDCGSSRLIVGLIARDIIINSNVTGGN